MAVIKTTRVEICTGGRLVSQMEPPKCMTMGPWIHHNQILAIDQTNLNGCLSLALELLPWIGDVAWPLGGPSGALVGPSGAAKWAQGSLPCPLASMCPYLSPFCQILIYYLHTNNFYKHKWN